MLPAMRMRERLSFEGFVAGALGATIFAFGLGSSSVGSLHQFGAHSKWIALGAMVPLSVALALRKRPVQCPAPLFYALAALLLLLAFDSALWSVAPQHTVKYATSLALLFTVVGALGVAATRPEVARALVVGSLAGAVAVAAGGIVLLYVHHSLAVQAASPGTPERYRGLTENPNTVSLLAALVLPLALWKVVTLRNPVYRGLAAAALLLLLGTIVASGSKGALGAGFLGTGAFALTFEPRVRPRLALLGTVVIAFAAGVGIVDANLSSPIQAPAVPAQAVKQAPPPQTATSVAPRLSDEIGAPTQGTAPQQRTLFGTSGRALAWAGAIHIGLARPIVGFGFGTEDSVFVDRWYYFQGDRPENSLIGIFLQLGLAGLAVLISIGVATLLAARRVLRSTRERALGAACLGVVIAGATLAIVQSYVYAVGDIGTLALWSTAFILAGMAGSSARGPA
jgi:hypothetical protein